MSDNFKVLGVGGAGVNVVRSLGYVNSVYIDSSHFSSLEGITEFLGKQAREENVVIVSSPAGKFSSSVLKTVCNVLNSKKDRVNLIAIMPFHSESPERKKRGDLVLKDLRGAVESTAIVENENFASSMREYPWTHVMSRVNEHIDGLVREFVSQTQGGSNVQQKEFALTSPHNNLATNAGISLN
jgi:cell division GTPase FtsZ